MLSKMFDDTLLRMLDEEVAKERLRKQAKIKGAVKDKKYTKNNNLILILKKGRYEHVVLVNKNRKEMFDLAEKLVKMGITANCVHPGGINTKMLRKTIEMMGWDKSIAKPLTDGSNSLVYAVYSPRLKEMTGKFLHQTHIYRSTDITYDKKARNKLKELTEDYTKLKLDDFL